MKNAGNSIYFDHFLAIFVLTSYDTIVLIDDLDAGKVKCTEVFVISPQEIKDILVSSRRIANIHLSTRGMLQSHIDTHLIVSVITRHREKTQMLAGP